MNNVVTFPGKQRRAAKLDCTASTASCGYTRRNQRNPLRRLWRDVEFAIVQVNKVDYQHEPDELGYIRDGVQAARQLAVDLASAAAKYLQPEPHRANTDKREFNEAVRQRIRDIAASRDLSDEEIKPVLRLKHHEIAKFTRKHGVNVDWLLEGKGRIFKKDAIRLDPNMTGKEFAEVASTLPPADQQALRLMIRKLLAEEGFT